MATARSIVAGAAITSVVAAVAFALYRLGSPDEERIRRLDTRRVENLREIDNMTNHYWTRSARLPASIDELSSESGVSVPDRDPATGAAYGYRIVSDKSFELCAVFDRASDEQATGGNPLGFWSHGAGRRCFTLTVREAPNR